MSRNIESRVARLEGRTGPASLNADIALAADQFREMISGLAQRCRANGAPPATTDERAALGQWFRLNMPEVTLPGA